MYTFNWLRDSGLLLPSIQLIGRDGTIALSDALEMDAEAFSELGSAVIADGATWVGTVNGVPVDEAVNVYSSDGNVVGRWNSQKREYVRMEMLNSGAGGQLSLGAKKIFKFRKEKKKMAELEGIKLDEESVLAELGEIAGVAPAQATSFGDEDVENRTTTDAKDAKKNADKAVYDSVRKRLEGVQSGVMMLPMEAYTHNRRYGRLIAFITPTDSVVKVSLASQVKLDETGKQILTAEARNNAEVVKLLEDGKKVKAEYCVRERDFMFKEHKPGKAKGIIVRTPAGTDIPLTHIGSPEVPKYEMTTDDYVVKVMDMETAWLYLDYNYGGMIKECEDLLGEQASTLTVEHKISNTAKGVSSRNMIKSSTEGRSLYIPGNYVPAKLFDTISTQALTDPKDKKCLDLNFEVAVSNALKKSEEISEKAKSHYSMGTDGSVTTDWIDKGAPIEVHTYYDKEEMVKNVRLPKRSKETTKSGNFTYKFVYLGLDDPNGPMSLPEVQAIMKTINYEEETFKKVIEGVMKSRKKGNGGSNASKISYEQYIRGKLSKDEIVSVADARDITELQAMMETLSDL